MASLPVPRIKLGSQGLQVSAQGLGCMGMTPGFYCASKPEQDMIDLIRYAVSCGITYFDTADLYGPFTNEILVGKAIKGIRDKVQIATKFGAAFSKDGFDVRGDPEYVRESCEGSLKRLDTDYIDLYFYNRADARVPIEITIGELKKLVEEGKVKYLGLSEMPASTIRRAHAVHPITAVQLEWSLWSREAEEEIIPTCRELGIGIVTYGSVGQGFLSVGAKVLEDLTSQDTRKAGLLPKFQAENLENNKVLYENLQRLASRKGCTPGQLALAWVQHQGGDVMPIPGTTKVKNFEENVRALAVTLSKEEMEEMNALFPPRVARGPRYAPHALEMSEQATPPLSSWQKG